MLFANAAELDCSPYLICEDEFCELIQMPIYEAVLEVKQSLGEQYLPSFFEALQALEMGYIDESGAEVSDEPKVYADNFEPADFEWLKDEADLKRFSPSPLPQYPRLDIRSENGEVFYGYPTTLKERLKDELIAANAEDKKQSGDGAGDRPAFDSGAILNEIFGGELFIKASPISYKTAKLA